MASVIQLYIDGWWPRSTASAVLVVSPKNSNSAMVLFIAWLFCGELKPYFNIGGDLLYCMIAASVASGPNDKSFVNSLAADMYIVKTRWTLPELSTTMTRSVLTGRQSTE